MSNFVSDQHADGFCSNRTYSGVPSAVGGIVRLVLICLILHVPTQLLMPTKADAQNSAAKEHGSDIAASKDSTQSGSRLAADTAWIKSSDDCQSFSKNLNAYVATLDKAARAEKSTQEVFKLIIEEACYGKHAVCGFALCAEINKDDTARTGGSQKSEKTPDAQARGALNPWQRLDWLNEPLTCRQLQARALKEFANVVSYKTLSERRKIELEHVLEASCSDRFQHCGFKSCRRLQRGLAPVAPPAAMVKDVDKAVAGEEEEAPEKVLARLVAQNKAMQDLLIKIALKEEKASDARWNQLSNKQEQREIAERKAASKESRETKIKPPALPYRSNVGAPSRSSARSSARPSGSGFDRSSVPKRTSRERPSRRTTAGIPASETSDTTTRAPRQSSKPSAPPLSGF